MENFNILYEMPAWFDFLACFLFGRNGLSTNIYMYQYNRTVNFKPVLQNSFILLFIQFFLLYILIRIRIS